MYLPRYRHGLHFLLLAIPCWAQGSASSDQGGWFARVARAQAAQPHWITPVVTVTPRLEEEFRYDISEQTQLNGARTEIYGGSEEGLGRFQRTKHAWNSSAHGGHTATRETYSV